MHPPPPLPIGAERGEYVALSALSLGQQLSLLSKLVVSKKIQFTLFR